MKLSSAWLELAVALSLAALAACAVAPPAAAEPRKKLPRTAAARRVAPAAAPRIGAPTAERVKKVWEAAAGGFGRAVAVSSRLRRAVFASKDSVDLFDLATGKPAGVVSRCRDVIHGGIGFSNDDLVIVCDKRVVLVDALKLKEKPVITVNSERISASVLVGRRLVLAHRDGVVRIYSLDGGSPVEIAVPGPPIDVKSLALSRDGSRLAVAWVQGSIWWWDVSEPTLPHDLVRHESESDALAFDATGTLLAEEGAPKATTIWSFADKPIAKHSIRNGNWVKRLAFTEDGQWLVRGGSDGLELAQIGGPKRVVLDTRSPVEDVALDETGSKLVAADRDGRLTYWAVR